MAQIVQLPDGRRVRMDGVETYRAAGNVLEFIFATGSVVNYLAAMPDATPLVTQIDTGVSTTNGTGLTVLNDPTVPVISYISPSNFNFRTDVITITGTGFFPNANARIYIEDYPSVDNNGVYMNVNYISPTVVTATFGGMGDFTSGNYYGAAMIYWAIWDGQYGALAGTVSNIISATLVNVNLVPPGSSYDGSGNIYIPCFPNTSYLWIQGANDTTFNGGTSSPSTSDGTGFMLLTGTPSASVTASVFPDQQTSLVTIP